MSRVEEKSLLLQVKLWDDPREGWIISPMKVWRTLIPDPWYPSLFITVYWGEWEVEGDKTKQIKLIKDARVATNPLLQNANTPQTSLAPVKRTIVILPGYEHRSKLSAVHRLLTRGGVLKITAPLFGRFPFCSWLKPTKSFHTARANPEVKNKMITIWRRRHFCCFWRAELVFDAVNVDDVSFVVT